MFDSKKFIFNIVSPENWFIFKNPVFSHKWALRYISHFLKIVAQL